MLKPHHDKQGIGQAGPRGVSHQASLVGAPATQSKESSNFSSKGSSSPRMTHPCISHQFVQMRRSNEPEVKATGAPAKEMVKSVSLCKSIRCSRKLFSRHCPGKHHQYDHTQREGSEQTLSTAPMTLTPWRNYPAHVRPAQPNLILEGLGITATKKPP